MPARERLARAHGRHREAAGRVRRSRSIPGGGGGVASRDAADPYRRHGAGKARRLDIAATATNVRVARAAAGEQGHDAARPARRHDPGCRRCRRGRRPVRPRRRSRDRAPAGRVVPRHGDFTEGHVGPRRRAAAGHRPHRSPAPDRTSSRSCHHRRARRFVRRPGHRDIDVVLLRARRTVAEDTFWPPRHHRDERFALMGNARDRHDGGLEGSAAGRPCLHDAMLPREPDRTAGEDASAEPKPRTADGGRHDVVRARNALVPASCGLRRPRGSAAGRSPEVRDRSREKVGRRAGTPTVTPCPGGGADVPPGGLPRDVSGGGRGPRRAAVLRVPGALRSGAGVGRGDARARAGTGLGCGRRRDDPRPRPAERPGGVRSAGPRDRRPEPVSIEAAAATSPGRHRQRPCAREPEPMLHDVALEMRPAPAGGFGVVIARTDRRERHRSPSRWLVHHAAPGRPVRIGGSPDPAAIPDAAEDARGALPTSDRRRAAPTARTTGRTRGPSRDAGAVTRRAAARGRGHRVVFDGRTRPPRPDLPGRVKE